MLCTFGKACKEIALNLFKLFIYLGWTTYYIGMHKLFSIFSSHTYDNPILFIFYFKFFNYIGRCIRTWKTWKQNWHLEWANQKKTISSLGGTTRNITPWFSWTHQILKNQRKHLNEHFHFFFWNKFIRFHRFWNLNNIKIIFYFDVVNHCIWKKFQECSTCFFPWTFWSKTQIWNMI